MNELGAMSGAGSEGGRDSPQNDGRSASGAPSTVGSARTAISAFSERMSEDVKEDIYHLIMHREVRHERTLRDVKRSASDIHRSLPAEAVLLLVQLTQDAIFEVEEEGPRREARDGQSEAMIENLREIQQLQVSLQGAQEDANREVAARMAAEAESAKWFDNCRATQDLYSAALEDNEKYVSASESRIAAMQDEISALKLGMGEAAKVALPGEYMSQTWRSMCMNRAVELSQSLDDMQGEINALEMGMQEAAKIDLAVTGERASAGDAATLEQVVAALARAKKVAEKQELLHQEEMRSLKEKHETVISRVREEAREMALAGTEVAQLKAELIAKNTEVEVYERMIAQTRMPETAGNRAKASSRGLQDEEDDYMSAGSRWDAEEAKDRVRTIDRMDI